VFELRDVGRVNGGTRRKKLKCVFDFLKTCTFGLGPVPPELAQPSDRHHSMRTVQADTPNIRRAHGVAGGEREHAPNLRKTQYFSELENQKLQNGFQSPAPSLLCSDSRP
jgi:hypothetical protein